jgi:hypothetical protein
MPIAFKYRLDKGRIGVPPDKSIGTLLHIVYVWKM